MTSILQTTIAGSLPKPVWLAEPNQLWAPWKLEGEALASAKQDAVRLALFDQEHAGIDIVTDGEQTRRHFVTTFLEGLDGVDFANKKTVRIRNRYDAEVPMVVGAVSRRHPIYVDDARFLNEVTTLVQDDWVVVRVAALTERRVQRLKANGKLTDEAQLQHSSELELRDYAASYRLLNDGYIDDLLEDVDELVNALRS